MFGRILSWIFSPGTTEVSIDRSSQSQAVARGDEPFDRSPKPEQSRSSIQTETNPDVTNLGYRDRLSLEFLFGEVGAARVTQLTHDQVEVLNTFSEMREQALEDELRKRSEYQSKTRGELEKPTVNAEPPVDSPHSSDSITEVKSDTALTSLTAMERTALYQLMGSRYVAETKTVSDSQLQVIRKFAGFDWLPLEREYWKNEYQAAKSHSPASRKIEAENDNVQSKFSTAANREIRVGKLAKSPTEQTDETEDTLNEEQRRVFDCIEETASNLFITGRAGSGKSFLLRYLLKHSRSRILPVAFMGIAALNIGGSTIHSAFKLPLHLLLPPTGKFIADRLSEEGRAHYREFRMLVVDEVSMVAADQFVAMDMFLRSIHENNEPFGGVQVVLFGDPYQLPPVVVSRTENEFYADNWGGPHFFKTDSWHESGFLKVELQGSERQSDRSFLEILDAMRVGELSVQQWNALQSRVLPEEELPDIGAVRIAPINELADRYNDLRLRQLPGTPQLFQGEATGEYLKNWKRLPAPMKLYLKPDAQVIMVKNDAGRRWVNGSVGRVIDVSQNGIRVEIDGLNHGVDVADWDKETYTYDRERKLLESDAFSRFRQYPIALGWARTIHKSQGQTFDKCVVDMRSKMFDAGQAYVACSRTRSLDSLYFNAPLTQSSVMTSDAVRNFMSDLVTPVKLPPF